MIAMRAFGRHGWGRVRPARTAAVGHAGGARGLGRCGSTRPNHGGWRLRSLAAALLACAGVHLASAGAALAQDREFWSANLTVRDTGSGTLGCQHSLLPSNLDSCFNTATLSDREFFHLNRRYLVNNFIHQGSRLLFAVDPRNTADFHDFANPAFRTEATLHVGNTQLRLSNSTIISNEDGNLAISWPVTDAITAAMQLGSTVRLRITGPNHRPAFDYSYYHQTCIFFENDRPGDEVCSEEDTEASDPDGDTITYRLLGRDASQFRIDSETGRVTVGDNVDTSTTDNPNFCTSGRVTVGGVNPNPPLTQATDGEWGRFETDVPGGGCFEFSIRAEDGHGGTHTMEVFARIMLGERVRLNPCDRATRNCHPDAPFPASSLTGQFVNPDEPHDGSTPFDARLELSVEPADLSYRVFQGDPANNRPSALEVTNGTLQRARRDGANQNRKWLITVAPTGNEAVTITLPATTDCDDVNAICTADGDMLEQAVTKVVPGPAAAAVEEPEPESPEPGTPAQPAPLTVAYTTEPPGEHDGESKFSFEVSFSENPEGLGFATMRDAFDIRRGGTALTPHVKRKTQGSNQAWIVTVAPGGNGDIAIALPATPDCGAAGAVCTGGESPRGLSAGLPARTVQGPPGLSVADASVGEAPGAAVAFAVTLGRAASSTVTVDYASSDGTATAGSDYTAVAGTIAFGPGETAKTVSVPVLDDAHDEGSETFTLTLFNPRGGNGAYLADATATGTIENSDAMPAAWLARFGRTVAEQAIEAVEGRFSAGRTAGVEMTLAGERIGLSGAGPEDAGAEDGAAWAPAGEADARARLAAMTDWLRGTEDADGGRAGLGVRSVTPRELLTGTSFALTGESAAGGAVSLWGRGAVSRFDGREGDLTLDGEVASLMMGADWARDRWTAGLLVSRSVGEGGYRGPDAAGTVESTLTALFPYGRHALNERVTLWGIAGWGAGELTLTPDGQPAMRTGMNLAMGAVGVRGVAVEAPAEGGFELSVKSDAMMVRTTSEKTRGLEAADADVTRLGLGLEGAWRGLALGTGTLVPTAGIGVRHDGGDAETGFGLDLGGGLAWSDPVSGVTAELRGRGLLTHESEGFRDRGISGSFAWAPGERAGRGPSLTLTQTLGASASGGVDGLLGQRHLGGLAAGDDGDDLENRRLELRMGYGFPAFGERFTATPEAGLGLSNGQREYSLGWRLGLAQSGATALDLTLEATRREAAGADGGARPEHGVGFQVRARW